MNYRQLVNRVQEASIRAAECSRRVQLGDLWERLLEIEVETIRERIDALRSFGWPGAIPVWEPLSTQHTTAAPSIPLTGVDGSQIYPVFDHPVRWAYIQACRYKAGAGKWIESQFLDIAAIERYRVIDEESSPRIGTSFVDAQRTLLELHLAQQVVEDDPTVFVLLDNPLLPFHLSLVAQVHQFETYLQTFAAMRGRRLAGYVSCPRSHLLFNLINLSEGDLDLPRERLIVEDALLMRYGLQIGQRSALFLHGSQRNQPFEQQQAAIYFFFLKVDQEEVARVEVPEWIARSPALLDQLQASLLTDSQSLGYPAALLQAHEGVSIPYKVGRQLQQLAYQTFIDHQGYFCLSAKQRLKAQRNR